MHLPNIIRDQPSDLERQYGSKPLAVFQIFISPAKEPDTKSVEV